MITPVPSPLVAGFVAGGGAPTPTPSPMATMQAASRAGETGGRALPAGCLRMYRPPSPANSMDFPAQSINGFTIQGFGGSFQSTDDSGPSGGTGAGLERLDGRILIGQGSNAFVRVTTPTTTGFYRLRLCHGSSNLNAGDWGYRIRNFAGTQTLRAGVISTNPSSAPRAYDVNGIERSIANFFAEQSFFDLEVIDGGFRIDCDSIPAGGCQLVYLEVVQLP